MREVLPGIFTWPWFSERHGYDFNGTLVRHATGNICVDPVEPPPAVRDRLAEDGVARIVLTNRNHTRAANVVRECTGARVAIHPADAAYARNAGTAIDDVLEVGERIGAFTVIHVPGKSPGEIALYDPERRLLIVGDVVVGNPPGRLSLLPETVMDDPPRLLSSVRRLVEFAPQVILTGDGVPILAGADTRLEELVASFPSEWSER
jgi:glyoxylase-like metal-dependent hydrolase (beta-lactamase superfamily II)